MIPFTYICFGMSKRSLLLILSLFLALPLLAATADLGIYSPSFIPVTLDPGDRFRLSLQAVSRGPDAAEHVRVTVSLPAGATLVSVESQFGPCTQTGSDIVCDSPTPFGMSQASMLFTIEFSHDLAGGAANVTARISSDTPDPIPSNNIFTGAFTIRRLFVVETDADSGSSSFRAQIDNTNTSCGDPLSPCKIAFARDMVIEPLSPLPAITACNTTIDGGGAAGAPLRVELRGDKVKSGSGLEIHATCRSRFFVVNGVTIHRVAVDGFPENGIGVITGEHGPGEVGGVQHTIQECNIGANGYRGIATAAPDATVNIYLNTIANNTASGIAFYSVGHASVADNHLHDNGASGVFAASGDLSVFFNEIAFNGQYGISTIGLVRMVHGNNIIRANGAQPLDFNMDGPSRGGPIRPPALTDAFYDAAKNRTFIRGHLSGNNDQSPTNEGTFHIAFSAGSRNAAGFVDIEKPVATSTNIVPIKRGDFDLAFEVSTEGDFRGQLIVGYTSYAPFGDAPNIDASEFSDPVPVR